MRTLGIIILLSVFAFLFYMINLSIGLSMSMVVWGAAIVLTAITVLAILLITK